MITKRGFGGKESKKSKKGDLRRRFLPQFLSNHGRTVYGGNPVVQQTLPGWYSYLSPFVMIPIYFVFMVCFVVVGAVVLVESRKRYTIDYVYSFIHQYQYIPSDPAVNINEGIRQFTADGVQHAQGTMTWVVFNVTKRMPGPVYMYYSLYNLYQNYRDFHDGRSNAQLGGKLKFGSTYQCDPFGNPGHVDNRGNVPVTYTSPSGTVTRAASSFFYNPCGIAAWSKFNDTFTLYRVLDDNSSGAAAAGVIMGGENGTLPLQLICNATDFDARGNPLGGSVGPNRCTKKGISWRADVEVRFRNLTISEQWWSLYFPYQTDNDYLNNGWYLFEPGHSLQDPSDLDLQVWMKSAVLPDFRKMYRIIDTDLDVGTYAMQIEEFYDAVSFRGKKGFVLRTSSWIGDRNIAIGVVFLVIGGLAFVLGVAFLTEFFLSRHGLDRRNTMKEPRRSWYVFDPEAPEFETYYQLRMERHIPVADLTLLRKTQDVSRDEDDA